MLDESLEMKGTTLSSKNEHQRFNQQQYEFNDTDFSIDFNNLNGGYLRGKRYSSPRK